ncbi:MAG: L-fucose/L-arabinose isomerase family protein [Candidatus Zipacnadales bacterium]
MADNLKLGLIPANRNFFSDALAQKMRAQTIAAMQAAGIEVVVPDETQTRLGCVETRRDAEICGQLFRAADVAGIVVGAMNFGDEQGVALTIREARLNVPILIFGGQEEEVLRPQTPRRDSFCGLISIAEALRQIDMPYTVAQRPICFPTDPSFAEELQTFGAVCQIVRGIRRARYGLVGTRPEAFWTCRTDEVALQQFGPTTVTLDLSEALARMREMSPEDEDVKAALADLKAAVDVSAITDPAVLERLCILECFLRRFAQENALDGLAMQCWSALQQEWGTCACTSLSRCSNSGLPAACEADVLGVASMHALQLASGTPAGLADWNNLHNEDDDLVNLWHCSAFPACFAGERPRLGRNEILGQNFGFERVGGTLEFRMKPQPVTLFRLSHNPRKGFVACVVHGQVEDNPATTFGAYGWCRIPNLLSFYRNVILRHFPHHIAFTAGHHGRALQEAFNNYLSTPVYNAGEGK